MAKKRIAVIGAGISGLGAIKCCLDEGLEPTCFERNDDIGGLWKFQKNTSEKMPSIYRSVTINTSKEMMCFSDFPIPDHFPNYMHNSKLMDYFRMYVKHFDLLKHICFKTKVRSVRKRPDFSVSGQWDVMVETNEKQETLVFDGVLVCSGHHTDPYLPLQSFPGIEKFEGCYFHSREYKSPEDFFGKRIIVVGIGNSGVDIAVELSRVAKQVFLSTRRGAWVLHRVWENGYPMDSSFFTRFNSFLQKISTELTNKHLEKILNSRFNHAHYGLKPQHRVLSQHPTVSDDLPNHIISGRVHMKPNVKEFTETDAIFDDGTIEEKIDVVIFATGYSFSFPFLHGLIKVSNNEVSLYKLMFPPDLEKPTLAVIGLIQPLGIVLPIAELQSRWATRVFKGLNKLPSVKNMMADIALRKRTMEKRYVKTPRHTIQVDHIEYMDEIATLVGVKPNLLFLFLSDPKLAMEVFFGPCTPYQYRLQGPGKWDGARRAILTQRQRIIKPLRTRISSEDSHSSQLSWVKMVPIGLSFLVVGLSYFRYIHHGKRK
ncbi:PREDICTED: dimethylaniline monooxygenase [N-oxide-forming] 5-like [Chrysochloris asiatica]|uniref:Flavin-containing monooxygenase n=1 Tax=Chrysochloris asiatica TaxID=185453 RepID=A0A9B0U2Z6_CHRAS|nr:PREDICTED: dimethylaniline monooxygenase [N-oxide-forming] 5-like [Chrysochloris asiatica]